MSGVDVVVVITAAALSAGLWRFFFEAKDASRAELRGYHRHSSSPTPCAA